jgi:HlyD family secretion protein
MKMKKWLALIITICLVVTAFAGCANPQGTAPEITVVTRGNLVISVPVSGNLEMPRKTDLSFGTTGMVEEVLVEEGDKVVKGQKLAMLDARSLELTVAMAQADYEAAEINLMGTIYPHYTKIWGIDLAGIWLALDEAQDNLEQAQELLNEGEIDQVYVLLGLIQEDIDKAESKSLSRPWSVPPSVRLLELQLDVAKANLDAAKISLEKATIVAPFDAVIADISIAEGKEVSTMTLANPAISLVDTSEIEMTGVIDEIDIAMVKLGQESDVILDALPDKELKGKVTFISQIGTVEAGVVGYDTTVTLENPDEELRDGMSATAEIILDRRDDVLLIPNRAIRGSVENPTVAVAKAEQIRSAEDVESRQVTLGLSDGITTEVLSGLKEGERVVIASAKRVAPEGGF